MKQLVLAAFLFGACGLCVSASAADKDDPTGTWKIKSKFGGKSVEQTLKIETKEGTVTGTITSGKMETKIEDGKFKDGALTFATTVEGNGVKVLTKYTAKVTGETMKGTSSTEFKGKEYKSDFEGKREKK